MDKLYTVQEVAMLLKVHPKTIKNYIDSNKIKASWFGNRWRIKESAIKEFVNEREKEV
jgi:excisionase family DNA binding protein